MGANNMTIDTMTIGVDHSGMDSYREALKLEVLTNTREKINEVADVENAINNAWQGVSRDRFLTQFKNTRESISDDLEAEYNDLDSRLNELEYMYYQQDQNMIEE